MYGPCPMFLQEWSYAIGTTLVVIVGFVCISVAATHSQQLSADWGDVNQGLLFRFTTRFLLRLDSRKAHAKFWQPQILVLQRPCDCDLSSTGSRARLCRFAADLKHSGLLTVGSVVIGELAANVGRVQKTIDAFTNIIVDKLGVKTFLEVTVAPSLSLGAQQLILTAGIGALRPNTVMFGMYGKETQEFAAAHLQWTDSTRPGERDTCAIEYVASVRAALLLRRTVLIARGFDAWSRESVSSALEASLSDWQRLSRIDVAGHGPSLGGKVDVVRSFDIGHCSHATDLT
jgi:hypothetical protein